MRKLNKVNAANNNTVEAYKTCKCSASCSCTTLANGVSNWQAKAIAVGTNNYKK